MAEPHKPPQELNTWSEIASYLDISVRAAQNYEKSRGLPVHRMTGEKSRVWAYRYELDAWKEKIGVTTSQESVGETAKASPVEAENPATHSRPAGRRNYILAAVGVVTVLISLVAAYRESPEAPSKFSLDGDRVAFLDRTGEELWQHTFPHQLNSHFYQPNITRPRKPWFGDLDGDGRTDILFPFFPLQLNAQKSALYLFSGDGGVKWTYQPGKELADAMQSWSDVYILADFRLRQKIAQAKPGDAVVIVAGVHASGYPCHVALLDSQGEVTAEYWHSGHLLRIEEADIDNDGVDEILLAGVNNGFRQATLVVLDSRTASGASEVPEGSRHKLQGFETGTEKAVVFFPRSHLNKALHAFNRGDGLQVSSNGIEVRVSEINGEDGPYVLYYFGLDLKPQGVLISSNFVKHYRELEAQGILKQPLDVPKEEQRLLREVRVVRR